MNFFKNDFIAKLDSKVNPKTGKFFAVFFKIFTLVIAIVGIIGLSIGFGAVGVDPSSKMPTGTILAVFIPWIVITITSSSLWFYFSKWNG